MTEPHAPSVRECENPISALANRIRSNIASLPERIDGMGWEFYLPDPLPDELDPVDETPALRGTEPKFVFRPETAGDDAICSNCGCPQSLHDEATGECPPLYDDSPCPVSDPCCEGGDGDCHDACQPPRRTDNRRRDDSMESCTVALTTPLVDGGCLLVASVTAETLAEALEAGGELAARIDHTGELRA